jgi:hypothetical protein
MTTNRKYQILGIVISVVIAALIATFVLKQYVVSVSVKIKELRDKSSTNNSLRDSYSGSTSYSTSGPDSDSDADSDPDYDFTRDFGVYLDIEFINRVFDLNINSDSGSTSNSGSQQESNTTEHDWLFRQPPPDLTQIVKDKYESCTGDIFGKAVNWDRVDRFCHHVIDTNLVNSFFQTANNIAFKHCRAHEYNEDVPKSEIRPCWPRRYSFSDSFDEFIWSDTTVGNWLQDHIGFRDIPLTSYRLQCYARKSLELSRQNMKQWYDSQSGCGDSLVGFMMQD